MEIAKVVVRNIQNDKVCVITFPKTLGEALYDELPNIVDQQMLDGKKCFIFE